MSPSVLAIPLNSSSLSLSVVGDTTEGVIPYGFWFSYGVSTRRWTSSVYYVFVLELFDGLSGVVEKLFEFLIMKCQ